MLRLGDSRGAITTEVDLLGRVVAYTDTNDKTTKTTYSDRELFISKTSPIGIETFEYDNYNRLVAHKLDGVTYATVSYNIFGREIGVTYANGVSSSIARDALSRQSNLSYNHLGGQISDSVVYSQSSKIASGTENNKAKLYTYDASGRLTGAEIGDNEFTYSFSTADASCSSLDGNNPNAGKSGNRTSQTVNGQTTTYCYDRADRLIGSSDNQYSNVEYDTRGNITKLGSNAKELTFTYDSSDRSTSVSQDNKTVSYTRDAEDRVISREVKDNGNTTSLVKYGFAGVDEDDAPAYLLDSNDTVIETYLSLPGDVLITVRPNKSETADKQTISLPNIHGDVMATLDGVGKILDTHHRSIRRISSQHHQSMEYCRWSNIWVC